MLCARCPRAEHASMATSLDESRQTLLLDAQTTYEGSHSVKRSAGMGWFVSRTRALVRIPWSVHLPKYINAFSEIAVLIPVTPDRKKKREKVFPKVGKRIQYRLVGTVVRKVEKVRKVRKQKFES